MNRTEAVEGNKYVVVGGNASGLYGHSLNLGDVVKLLKDDGTSRLQFERVTDGRASWIDLNHVEPYLTSKVEIAKAYLAKAQADLDAAVKAEEDSKKFQESDIKSLMVVSASKTSDDLRLVVIGHEGAYWFNKNGDQTNSCRKDNPAILRDLNHIYYKTTKTLKDFANA